MTPAAAIENIIFFGLPVVIYAVVVRWRAGLSASEIAKRLGLSLGTVRAFGIALAGRQTSFRPRSLFCLTY